MFGEHTRELPHPTCFSLRDRFVSLADSFFAVSRLSQRCSCSQADRVQTAEHKEMCFIIFCRFIPEGSNLESMQVNKYHCSIKVFASTGDDWAFLVRTLAKDIMFYFWTRQKGYYHSASLQAGVNVPVKLVSRYPCHELPSRGVKGWVEMFPVSTRDNYRDSPAWWISGPLGSNAM